VRKVAGGLCVQIEGSGPPVVLLHSGVADSRTWDGVVRALARSYTVLRPDRRGFGTSPVPTAGFRHLDDLLAVLDELALTKVALVGNSAGGKLALDLAGTHPERVSHLAMLAPPIGGWSWSAGMRAYFAAEDDALTRGDLDAALQVNLDQWIRGPVREWSPELRRTGELLAGSMREVLAHQVVTEEQELDDEHPPVEEQLASLTVPTLVGVGDQDVEDFSAIADHLAGTIPGAERVDFPGAGHLLPVDQPEQVAGHLLRLLSA
jgi:3-oxoadipate enol-lactonase